MTPIIQITRQDDIMNVRRALQRQVQRRRRISCFVFRYATPGLACMLLGAFLVLLFMGVI